MIDQLSCVIILTGFLMILWALYTVEDYRSPAIYNYPGPKAVWVYGADYYQTSKLGKEAYLNRNPPLPSNYVDYS